MSDFISSDLIEDEQEGKFSFRVFLKRWMYQFSIIAVYILIVLAFLLPQFIYIFTSPLVPVDSMMKVGGFFHSFWWTAGFGAVRVVSGLVLLASFWYRKWDTLGKYVGVLVQTSLLVLCIGTNFVYNLTLAFPLSPPANITHVSTTLGIFAGMLVLGAVAGFLTWKLNIHRRVEKHPNIIKNLKLTKYILNGMVLILSVLQIIMSVAYTRVDVTQLAQGPVITLLMILIAFVFIFYLVDLFVADTITPSDFVFHLYSLLAMTFSFHLTSMGLVFLFGVFRPDLVFLTHVVGGNYEGTLDDMEDENSSEEPVSEM